MGQHLAVGPQGRLEEALFLLAVNPAESQRFVPEVRNSTCWNSGWVVSATAPLLCPSSGLWAFLPPSLCTFFCLSLWIAWCLIGVLFGVYR